MKIFNWRTCLALLTLATLGLATDRAAHSAYTVTDLGYGVRPTAINNVGQVTGWSNSATNVFLYNTNDGSVQNLGRFGGNYETISTSINNNGQITVYAQDISTGPTKIYIYDSKTGATHDMRPNGGPADRVFSINDAGQAVGTYKPDGAVTGHNYLYTNGEIVDIGTWGMVSPTNTLKINNSGQIAGNATTGSVTRAYISKSDGTGKVDIGDLGNKWVWATDLNDSGQVVGYTRSITDNKNHGFLYSDGQMLDLGVFDGRYSYASGVNNKGQIVGYYADSNNIVHPFVYSDGMMTDLTDQFPAGWLFAINAENQGLSVLDINDDGLIIGLAELNGQRHGFIMTPEAAPVPIPQAFLLFGSGLAGFGFLRRRFLV